MEVGLQLPAVRLSGVKKSSTLTTIAGQGEEMIWKKKVGPQLRHRSVGLVEFSRQIWRTVVSDGPKLDQMGDAMKPAVTNFRNFTDNHPVACLIHRVDLASICTPYERRSTWGCGAC